MSNRVYSEMSSAELLKRWDELRERILAAKRLYDEDRARGVFSAPKVSAEDWDAAFAMRRELDKRTNESKPSVDVDFTDKYLTD